MPVSAIDTESEALLAEKNVSAVCGVDGPDGVVLGEVYDISVPGTNAKSNFNALASTKKNTIFTNVALVSEETAEPI